MQVVVATPGRLWELMQEGHAHLTDMSSLTFFVLDEADRMVQQGHFQVRPCPNLPASNTKLEAVALAAVHKLNTVSQHLFCSNQLRCGVCGSAWAHCYRMHKWYNVAYGLVCAFLGLPAGWWTATVVGLHN